MLAQCLLACAVVTGTAWTGEKECELPQAGTLTLRLRGGTLCDAGHAFNGVRGGGSGTNSFGTTVLKMVGSCFGGEPCDVVEACIPPPVDQRGCCCVALEEQKMALQAELTRLRLKLKTARVELLARESELLDKKHLEASQELMLLSACDDQLGAARDSADAAIKSNDVIRRSYSVELALASLLSPSPKRAKEEAARGAAHVGGNSPLDCSLHESRGQGRVDETPRAVYRGSLHNRAEAAETAAQTGEAHAGARGSALISGELETRETAHVRGDSLLAPSPTATARSAAQDAAAEAPPAVYRGSLWFDSQTM